MTPSLLTQRGAAVAIFAVLTALLSGFIAFSMTEKHLQHQRSHIEDTRNLSQIKEQLLAASMMKGQNSLSDPGNLPCPAPTPASRPPARCDNAHIGYLPVMSYQTQSYLNLTVASTNSRKAYRHLQNWQYVVSPQLVQPNAMGWSQSVDWEAEGLSVLIEDQTQTELAAVVAETIEPTSSTGVIHLSGRHIALSTEEVKIINSVNQLQVARHLMAQLPATIQYEADPHLGATQTDGLYKANPTGCECRCTKTRCTCTCEQEAQWQSESGCVSDSDECLESPSGLTLCQSSVEKPCRFNGPAGLGSGWPVSRMMPLPVKGSACLWTEKTVCNPSTSSTACTCEFDWPKPLHNFEFRP